MTIYRFTIFLSIMSLCSILYSHTKSKSRSELSNSTETNRSNNTTKGHIKSASVSSPGPSNESTGQTDTLRQRLEIELNRLFHFEIFHIFL